MKNIKFFFRFLIPFLVLIFIAIPVVVLAAEGDTGDTGGTGDTGDVVSYSVEIKNPFKQDSIEGLINTIINEILIPIGGVVATVMIIYAGFLFVTAKGSPDKISKAKNALLWGVIGAAILLGAWVISEAISGTIEQLKG